LETRSRPDEKDASNGGSRIDPGTMFTMMFGSDQFDPYLGTLAAASMADRVARPPDEVDQKCWWCLFVLPVLSGSSVPKSPTSVSLLFGSLDYGLL
jgi:hypothetical protein